MLPYDNSSFTINIHNGLTHDWLLKTSQPGYTGTSYLQALPDIDIPLVAQTEAITGSPTAHYPIHFTTPGTYTVWSRANAPNAAGDSLYIGLDGQPANSDQLTGFAPLDWSWAGETMSGIPATLKIDQSGLHTLYLWLREDGLAIDRLLLTTNETYTPMGDGPPESNSNLILPEP